VNLAFQDQEERIARLETGRVEAKNELVEVKTELVEVKNELAGVKDRVTVPYAI
jgi:hypothetical protein